MHPTPEIPENEPENRSALSARRAAVLPFSTAAVAAAIFVLELLLSSVSLLGFPGPERYFAYQWSVSYAHGLSRRGLLGEALRWLHLDNGNYLLIAVLGWLITLALFAVVASAVIRLVRPRESPTGAVLMVAVLLSPVTTGILMSTTADPIQLTLLLFLLLTLILLRPGRNALVVFAAFAVYGAVSILIHEATLFFVGPVLAAAAFLLRRSRLDRVALAGYLLGALPLLLFTITTTEHHAATAIAPMHLGSTFVVARHPVHLETFSALLAEENAQHFHSGLKGYGLTLRNLVGALWLPTFFTVLLSFALPRATTGSTIRPGTGAGRRWWPALLAVLLLSSPLWAIAHDWGRFTSYLFLTFLVVLSGEIRNDDADRLPRPLPPALLAVLLVLAGVTTTRMLPQYIIKGLGDDDLTMAGAMFLTLIALWILARSRGRSLSPSRG